MDKFDPSVPNPSGETILKPCSVEGIAEQVKDAFSAKWTTLEKRQDTFGVGRVDEGEYYRTAGAFANRLGFDGNQARELMNFEIHQGFGPVSAEFRLLASPVGTELLYHAFALYYDEPIEKTIS